MSARGRRSFNGERTNARKKITKYHVKRREGPRVGDDRAARSRHGRHVINGWPAVSKKKTSLAREWVEERSRCEGYSHKERLERRRDVHAIHAVQDLLRHTIRCAL